MIRCPNRPIALEILSQVAASTNHCNGRIGDINMLLSATGGDMFSSRRSATQRTRINVLIVALFAQPGIIASNPSLRFGRPAGNVGTAGACVPLR